MDNDDELISCCCADSAAFRELVERYQRRIYSFLIHLVGRQAAEDLFQEVWVRVFKNAATYEPCGKAASWLFKIANNLALDYLSKQRRVGNLVDIDEAALWLSDSAPGP
ncbi:MAG: sigma-70 family RNA polymerase sigma factor, partial [Elusimicrobia bacterium]|nr:sigma-70 family RNA polymerase sigma factor [Elusimicrobiota bacterium]